MAWFCTADKTMDISIRNPMDFVAFALYRTTNTKFLYNGMVRNKMHFYQQCEGFQFASFLYPNMILDKSCEDQFVCFS